MKPFSMPFIACLGAIIAWAPPPALADDCAALVAQMFNGGPLDAYQRPAHRHVKQVLDTEGTITSTFHSIVETPLRTISGVEGGAMTLAIDDNTWTGPGPDGPWVASENNMPKNRAVWHRAMLTQQAKNLSETECSTGKTLEGATYDVVQYTSQTDPNPDMNNAFFGSTDTAYIDPTSGQIMILEQTGFFSSWLPEPGKDTHITRFQYDPSIKIMAPE